MAPNAATTDFQQPSAPKTAYFLPSDAEERRRLGIQHNLLLNATGGKHIHAPIDLAKVASVLECGTGSGVWIQEVAKLVPDTAELIGVDIETGLVPRAPSLPPNLQFQRQSVLDLPQEWTNKFDVVHQRLLLLGLREGEWRTALSEIYRVLKPGGWFQLFEIDEWEQSGPELTKFCNLFTLLSAARGIHGFWPLGAEKWQKYVAEAGFGDLQVSWHYSPMGKWAGEEGLLGQENRLSLLSGCKKPIVDAGGFGIISGAKEFDNLLAKVEKEFDAQKTRNRYIMICGRKPM